MINLLPKEEKDALRREYRLRLAAVFLWFLFAAILIASALLVPSYVSSVQKEKVAAHREEILSHSVSRDAVVKENAILQLAQGKVGLASVLTPSRYLFERIAAVARQRPAGISLNSFSIVPAEEGARAFFISGIAAERSILVSFAETIKQAGLFDAVLVPLSLLAKESGIPFTLRAVGSF